MKLFLVYLTGKGAYITTRGRVVGFYTIASPLGTAVFPNFLTRLISATTDDITVIWPVVGAIICVLGVVFYFTVRRTPEEVGLSPDGVQRDVEELKQLTAQEENQWPLKRIVRCKEAWLLAIGAAGWSIVMGGFMPIFVPRMMELGFSPIEAVNRLSIASVLGIGLSVIWGVLDDKLGTPKTGALLGVAYFLMSLAMYIAGVVNNSVVTWIAVIGVAAGTGGIPNLQPSSFAYVFGRKQFMYANKYVNPVMMFIAAPVGVLFNLVYDITGSYNPVYIACMVAAAISVVCFLLIRKTYDPERLAIDDAVK